MKKIVLLFVLVFITMVSPYMYGETSYDKRLEVSYQVDANYPPYTYTNKEYLYGFDFDLTNLIFNSPEYNLKYSVDSWNMVYKRLVREEIDLAGIIAINEDRKKEVLFTEPLFKTYVAIYTKGNFKEVKLENLEKLKIGVGNAYYTESILRDKLDIPHYTKYENIIEAVQDLETGRIDIIFENQQLMDNILIAEGLKGSIIPQMTDLFPVEFAYGISKSRPDLVQYMNDRIRQLKKEGVFEELYIKYFYRHSEEYIQKGYIKIVLGVTLGILCICIIMLSMRSYIIHLKKKLETNYIHLRTANQELTLVHEELQAQYEEIQKQYKEIEIKQTELEMMAYYDNLTNLPNRVFANEKLSQVLEDIKVTGEKAAAYYIEIDNFKHINDTLGHDFGDLLIKCVGEKLSHIINEHSFTARLGGDEYVILVYGLSSKESVIRLAEQVMSLF
ncbi:MAG: hypothetical protein K0R69_2398, partial [Clostridia bacterium]|nr:hypothetical protein [Clostridia bacterium]